jgi:5,5'-dehydrodivanillate O-demethylase
MTTVTSKREADGARPYRAADYTDFAHTGPGTLAGRYLRRFWQPVGVAADLPPGRAKPIRMMSEDFTLYRGEGGEPHLVAYRCAHRGTQLSTGWVEGDCIRCFYHGWKYDGTGQCVEMPAEDASFPPKVKIRSYPTEEYLGLIFAYLGEDEPPPLAHLPELEHEGILLVDSYIRRCNYFQNIENGVDSVHVAFVHRVPHQPPAIPRLEAEETEYGLVNRGTRPDGQVRAGRVRMPNILHIKFPPEEGFETAWRDHVAWRVPVDDEQHQSFVVVLVHGTGEAAREYGERRLQQRGADARAAEQAAAQAVLRGELRMDALQRSRVDGPAASWPGAGEAPAGVNLVWVEDEVAQVGQGPIADRTHERLGRSDGSVILLRKLWARELEALANGRPLKQWTSS